MPRKALLYGAATAALIGLAPASALADTTTFTATGEHAFTVPSGVTSLQVDLTGAKGGSSNGNRGGAGATVSGSLAVTPGQSLYAEVGGAGANGDTASGMRVSGGSNGGGAGAAGGGGASDIRQFPAALAGSISTRLAVAGGGGGSAYKSGGYPTGEGGDAGKPGADATGGQAGGRPGTQTAGGDGGAATILGPAGAAGGLGNGGIAALATYLGGGGGGGYYGGGSGGGMGPCNPCNLAGGGGGGSSLVPTGGKSGLAALDAPPQVQISWEKPTAQLSRSTLVFADTQPGEVSPLQAVTLTNKAASSRLEITDAVVDSGDFAVASSTCRSVAPGASCVVQVRFAPAATGAKTGTLTLSGNGPDMTVALTGRAPAPTPATMPAQAPAGQPTTQAKPRSAATTRVTCHKRRCTVRFANGAPRVTAKRAKVTAKLTRGGVTYATWHGKAKRGPLHLTLKAKRTLKPGRYTLTVTIGGMRITRTATV